MKEINKKGLQKKYLLMKKLNDKYKVKKVFFLNLAFN